MGDSGFRAYPADGLIGEQWWLAEIVDTDAVELPTVRPSSPRLAIVAPGIYRNHPDVLAGNRPGRLDAEALGAVDATADGLDVIDCIHACDRLATLTSLAGFEALIRGKAVSTYGRPFYAGWGLTDDRLTFQRRTRRATLDELVHAALIAYPVYVSPTGWPCEAEDLVEALIAARGRPVPPPPNQIARWWKGIRASLDRTPPPAY